MSDSKVIIQRVTQYSEQLAAEVGALLPYIFLDHPGTPVSKALLEEIIQSDRSDKIVAMKDGKVVGTATMTLIVADLYSKAHLDNFITHPDIRGTGVGLALWEEIITWGKEKGASKVSLVSDSEPAIEFYLHRGAVKRNDFYFNLAIE